MKGTPTETGDSSSLTVEIQQPSGSWTDVGNLARAGETNWFESSPSYWELDTRPVLGQVFEEHGPGWRPVQRVALPTWFSHLLPEGRLRQAVAEAAKVKTQREFFLLARIGADDLPGAIRVAAAAGRSPIDPPDIASSNHADDADLSVLKFSLAGVQLKFSVVEHRERGLTVPATGEAGNCIAKLPDPRPDFEGVPEAELASLELARASGIPTPSARLVDVNNIGGLPRWAVGVGGSALAVERFDRSDDGRRVHVEELAQVLDVPTGHERFKYHKANFETIATATSALCGPDSVGAVIDRIVFNVLIGNGDAHAKNWAYVYPDGRTPHLSPAYDLVPTVLYIANDDLGLKLNGSRRFEDVTPSSFDRLAIRAGWTVEAARARTREVVQRVDAAWKLLDQLLPRSAVDRLTERRDRLPLARERA